MIKHILLTTDLEQTADNVAVFALAIADNFKAELTVFHSYGQPHISYGDTPEIEREGRVLVELRKLITRLKGPSFEDVVIHYAAAIDYPGDGIISEANSGKYQLMLCGLREAQAGGSQFTSLTYRLLREIKIDILAIPPQADFHGVKEIVFATDFQGGDETVLEELQAWRQNMLADLYIVHIWADAEDAERARELMTSWRDRYASRPRMHFELMEGSFTSDIGDYVRHRGGDMLVVESSPKGFFQRIFGKNHTNELAHTTDVPLLVMRAR